MQEEEQGPNLVSPVFVLGAGFTKAFLPHAPLLVDHYQIDHLLEKYQHLWVAEKFPLEPS